jgi:hypothetical protein
VTTVEAQGQPRFNAVSPNEIDALIDEAGRRGFLWHLFRTDRHGPEVLAGVLRWPDCADVVVLIDDRDSHAYRVPTGNLSVDVFAPTCVHWFYGLSAEVGMAWVLRALLTLPRPDQPAGLPVVVPAPTGIGVAGDRSPVVIRKRLEC